MTRLEQSIDSIAIEVERVGEGQRFMTGFFADDGFPRAAGGGPDTLITSARAIHIQEEQ